MTALSVAVAATSIAVPPLVLSWSRQDVAGRGPRPGTPSASAAATGTGAVTATGTGAVTGSAVAPRPPAPSPSVPAPTFRPLRIDAADPANERSGVTVTACPSCASGRRVQYLGQGHVLVVHVRGVPVAGRRTLTVVYECDRPRTLRIDLDGARTVSLVLSGAGDWTTPARTSLPVDLPAGDSVLRFFNATDAAPDLDQIRIG